MKFSNYQMAALATANYPADKKHTYPLLGLISEIGEVAGQVKRIYRDDGGALTPERRDKIVNEIGDVLWYLAAYASDAGVSCDEWPLTDTTAAFSPKCTFPGVVFVMLKAAYRLCVPTIAVADAHTYLFDMLAACYVGAALCGETLEATAERNLDKLAGRALRGTLGGQGDDR